MGHMPKHLREHLIAAPSRLPTPVAMAHEVMKFKPMTDAEALKVLRAQFPNAPLSLRVAALAFLMQGKSAAALAHAPAGAL